MINFINMVFEQYKQITNTEGWKTMKIPMVYLYKYIFEQCKQRCNKKGWKM